jgi:hypothetical protein
LLAIDSAEYRTARKDDQAHAGDTFEEAIVHDGEYRMGDKQLNPNPF